MCNVTRCVLRAESADAPGWCSGQPWPENQHPRAAETIDTVLFRLRQVLAFLFKKLVFC